MISFHGMALRESRTASRLIEVDWSGTGLGPPATWSPALKTAAQLTLNAYHPMALFWGRDHLAIYNDGFLPLLAARAPELGAGPVLSGGLARAVRSVLEDGAPLCRADEPIPLERGHGLEEAYFTLSFSPVKDEDGRTQGVLAIAEETTSTVLQARRSQLMTRLSEELATHPVMAPTGPSIHRALCGAGRDFHRAALFGFRPDGQLKLQWSEPADFADEVTRGGTLSGRLQEEISGAAKYQGVSRLGERRHALIVADAELFAEAAAYVLVVEAHHLVRIGDSYRRLLHNVLTAVGDICLHILTERRDYLDVARQRDERERMYRLLFEHSRDAIIIATPEVGVIAANPAACAMLGYTEEEIVGVTASEIIVNEGGRLTHALSERQKTGSFVGEVKVRRKDGTEGAVDISSVMFHDEATGEARAVNLLRDAGPRLMAERHIASAARLEAIGQLTGGISHDFNNLLSVIINGAEDLRARLPEADPARRSADLVLGASLKASHLTRQLLAFSRQQPMELGSVDLARLVAELDQILERTVGPGIAVTLDLAPDLYARTDGALLQSAILNLCINARDAMPGGGSLTVAAAPARVDGGLAETLSLPAGEYARIVVADTGVGIDEQHLARVVEPFFTTKPAGKGTGLGLSMVYGLAKQSGGALHLRSQRGRGTRAEIYLPLGHPAESPAAPEAAAADPPAPAEPPPAAAARHLLVVEDNELLSSMLSRILQGAGYRVTVCEAAEPALQMVEGGEEIALVITDIQLGAGMDGWALAERLASCAPGLPVLTMSGFAPADPDAEPGAWRAPMLRKPFRPREILALIDELLS